MSPLISRYKRNAYLCNAFRSSSFNLDRASCTLSKERNSRAVVAENLVKREDMELLKEAGARDAVLALASCM